MGHTVRSESALPRWSAIFLASLAMLIVLLFVFSSAGAAIASPFTAANAVAIRSGSSAGPAPSIDSANSGVLARCLFSDYLSADAYDPADGYIYALGSGEFGNVVIVIVEPPCTEIKSIVTGTPDYSDLAGVAYDPLTKEMIVTDIFAPAIYVLQGTSIVKTLPGVFNGGKNPAWDGAIGSLLIPDLTGVSVLHLYEVQGTTRATVAFDRLDPSDCVTYGNCPSAVLVADGYIFAAGNDYVSPSPPGGNGVDVFNDRTLAYVGSFHLGDFANWDELAADPLDHSVVLGRGVVASGDSVLFLDVNSIASHKFTVIHFSAQDERRIGGAVWAVAYSPAMKTVYVTTAGDEVWAFSQSGVLTQITLGKNASVYGLTYDPVGRDMYVVSWGPPGLYVTR
jgi:DNA-binding beta-propeller fold protein YncE